LDLGDGYQKKTKDLEALTIKCQSFDGGL